MKELFTSATIKLTAWYLAVLMILSLLFSIVIYQLSTSEIRAQIGMFEDRYSQQPNQAPVAPNRMSGEAFRLKQLHQAEGNLLVGLLYTNLVILVIGGLGSYVLARRTLEPIEAAHEAQARFTSDASHELRTPLAVMKSELEVALRAKTLSKADMKELLESNLEEVNRLSILSTTLLKLSKGASSLSPQKISLTDSITNASSHRSFDQSRIQISTPKRLTIRADQTLIEELLMIVLDNAHRYSTPGSPITISATRKRDTITIKITNNGEGIAEHDLPHVFDRFYRGDKSRTSQSNETGYGLGLSLARQIVEAHNGTIHAVSTPGKTTSVIITLKDA